MRPSLLAGACLLVAGPLAAQGTVAPLPPLDGPNRPVADTLLDKLVGRWDVARTRQNKTVTATAEVDWVLNHQFLRLHYLPARDSTAAVPYEAMVFIGYDNGSDRYVVHWLDVFGGR